MKRRIRRILAGILLLTAILAIVGAAWETLARRAAARRFPPPGQMVDVGGRRLQMDCRGAGSPTVVLESGMDNFGSLSWTRVHDSIARTTRACAYSRAGIMWSGAAPGRFDSRRAAGDLHAALLRAGERPPWVLVGHSMGGPYALAFTGRFPAEVAGLVLVDASHPDQRSGSPSLYRRTRDMGARIAGPVLLRLGAGRLLPVERSPPDATPALRAAHRAYFPTSVAALLKEYLAIDASLRTAGRHRRLGDRPLVVLTGARRMPPAVREREGITEQAEARQRAAWTAFHADAATWSTRARHEVLDDAGHSIHVDRPDAVIRAVREVVAAVREPRPSAAAP